MAQHTSHYVQVISRLDHDVVSRQDSIAKIQAEKERRRQAREQETIRAAQAHATAQEAKLAAKTDVLKKSDLSESPHQVMATPARESSPPRVDSPIDFGKYPDLKKRKGALPPINNNNRSYASASTASDSDSDSEHSRSLDTRPLPRLV